MSTPPKPQPPSDPKPPIQTLDPKSSSGDPMEKRYQEQRKDQEEKRKKSDENLTKLKKEIEDNPQERLFKGEDEFKTLAEKLSKARERFLKTNQAAGDSEDPNIEELRQLRSKSYGEYKIMLEEITRRANLELESH